MRTIKIILFLLTHSLLSSQTNTWTWMKGDNSPNQLGQYGIQNISSPTNKPPATYEGAEWKDLSGNFWLYDNFDLWKFNPTNLEWTWIKGSQGLLTSGVYGTKGVAGPLNHPGYRGLAAASWVDLNGNLWMYGGNGLNGLKNDLWKFNIASLEWTWVNGDSTGNNNPQYGIKGVPNALNNPGGRNEGSATWTDSNNKLWLFGGNSVSGLCNSLWQYNISTNEWTWISGDNFSNPPGVYGIKGVANINNRPSGRMCYSKWIRNDTLWLFGGESNLVTNNDLWLYSISSNQWTWVNGPDTAGNKGLYILKCDNTGNKLPRSRMENRSCWKDFNENFWMYGGSFLNDLWVYNPNANKWTWVNGDSIPNSATNYGTFQVSNPNNNPGARIGSVSWIDGFNNLWLFGGSSSAGTCNDLWKYEIGESCDGLYTGITEYNSIKNLKIFPLPFKDKINIELELEQNSDLKVCFRNFQGQLLKETHIQSTRRNFRITCDYNELNLTSGIYVLDIYINNKNVTRKVIKLDN